MTATTDQLAAYRLPFGSHRGQPLDCVPEEYVRGLASRPIFKHMPLFWERLTKWVEFLDEGASK